MSQQPPQGPFGNDQPPPNWQYPPQQQPYQQWQASSQPFMQPRISVPPYQVETPGYSPPPTPRKWYTTSAGIITLLILFFPVGLYLMWRYSRWPSIAKVLVTAILVLFVLVEGITNTSNQQSSQATNATNATAQQPVIQATDAPTDTPTAQPINYPPTTEYDLRGLASMGDASAVHEFHSESVGLTGACPQPKREVTVDPSITGKQFTEDILAYFYAQHLDSPCGSIVFVYHNQAEVNDPNTGGTYTAGLLNFDVTDASGQTNTDPNASNLTHKLTLDIGALGSSQEYVVTY